MAQSAHTSTRVTPSSAGQLDHIGMPFSHILSIASAVETFFCLESGAFICCQTARFYAPLPYCPRRLVAPRAPELVEPTPATFPVPACKFSRTCTCTCTCACTCKIACPISAAFLLAQHAVSGGGPPAVRDAGVGGVSAARCRCSLRLRLLSSRRTDCDRGAGIPPGTGAP